MITQMLIAGSAGFTAESKAYFAEMAVQLDNPRKVIIDRFVRKLLTGNIWPYLGAVYIHTLNEEQQSLLNLINPTSTVTNLTKIGSPIWAANVGWTGTNSNSNRLSSAGNINNAEFKYASGDGSMGAYVRSNGTVGSRAVMGCSDNRQAVFSEYTAGNMGVTIQAAGVNQAAGGTTAGAAFKHGGRNGGSYEGWFNKTSIGTATTATVAPPASPLHILTNANSWPSSATTAFSYCGAYIPTTERELFSDAVNALISELDAV